MGNIARGVALGLMLGLLGCLEDGRTGPLTNEPGESTVGETGSLTLQLTGTDEDGRSYRLRSAEFVVAPVEGDGEVTPTAELSTEMDPEAEMLAIELRPALYTVTLRGDWYLERTGDGGTVRLTGARLISPAQQQTEVYPGQVTEMAFQFEVDDTGGTLVVDIDIRHRDAGVDADADAGLDGGGSAPPPMAGGMDAGTGIDAGEDDAGELADAGVNGGDAEGPDEDEDDAGDPPDDGNGGELDAGTGEEDTL